MGYIVNKYEHVHVWSYGDYSEQTDTAENMTFPQTMSVNDNNHLHAIQNYLGLIFIWKGIFLIHVTNCAKSLVEYNSAIKLSIFTSFYLTFFSRLQHPNKAANVLEADHQQKVTMKFQLRDRSSGEVMTAHQTFIRLTNLETQQEIIFVSEPDASDTYKFDLVSCSLSRIVSISSTILFIKVCLHGTV